MIRTMTIDTKKLYETNKDFQIYVNAYSIHYNEGRSIDVSDALEHRIVRNVAEQIGGKDNANFTD